ncbi:MAG: hypothetical protein IJP78_08485 [Clostridia bacterium]|nr:hypothetical protein [Clostridia bacterium]
MLTGKEVPKSLISGSPRPYMRGNPAAPFFDDVHVLERCADGDIPHTGIAFDQLPLVRSGLSLPGDVTSNKIIISESAIRFNQRKMKNLIYK